MPESGISSFSVETCVLRYALEKHARLRGHDIFAVFEDEPAWTFRETLDMVRITAAGLQALGVRQGDTVILMLPNCGFALRVMFAINYIGAVCAPINTAYMGSLLAHVLTDAGAAVAVIHPKLLSRVLAARAGNVKQVVVMSATLEQQPVWSAPLTHPATVLTAPLLPPQALARDIQPWDTQSIIYTSGTTGPSKGVLSSYMHSYSSVGPGTWTCVTDDDRQLVHLPLFHIGGAFVSFSALCRGSSIAVAKGFVTDTFWDTVRALKATSVFLLGVMATFLLKQPPRPDDRDHPLRMAFIVPLGQSGPAFSARFGADVFTLFNMTEISTPLLSGINPHKPNICGRTRPGVQLRLVDANDCEVPEGEAGELIIRTDLPWTLNHGYHNNPEATARAWRNGWFHTGDTFCRDADGDYYFRDRLKDSIRRRGENISSYEVEVELLSHPSVREAAAIAVASAHGEDEVMAVVAPVDGREIVPIEIFEHLRTRLAHFMLPRYIRVMPELPKTPTAKVQKHVLREQGVTHDTLDLQGAGFSVKRQVL